MSPPPLCIHAHVVADSLIGWDRTYERLPERPPVGFRRSRKAAPATLRIFLLGERICLLASVATRVDVLAMYSSRELLKVTIIP